MQKTVCGRLGHVAGEAQEDPPGVVHEEMVLRIVRKSFAEQTNDLESSDYDSYFFKCRAGKEDWQLRWCVGYQRADLEPLRPGCGGLPTEIFWVCGRRMAAKRAKRKRPG